MEKIIIYAHPTKYNADEVRSLTAADLISLLNDYEPDTPVVLAFDGGYTYGGIQSSDINLED